MRGALCAMPTSAGEGIRKRASCVKVPQAQVACHIDGRSGPTIGEGYSRVSYCTAPRNTDPTPPVAPDTRTGKLLEIFLSVIFLTHSAAVIPAVP